MPTAAPAQALRRMAADELTGVYEGHALRELTDEGARGGGGFVVGMRRHGGRRFLAFAAALTALFLGVGGGAGRFFGRGYGLCARGGGRFGSGGALFG